MSLLIGAGFTPALGLCDFDQAASLLPHCLLVLTLWHFWSWRISGHALFEPYGLFMLAATLFNAGQAILEALHLNEYGILNGNFNTPLVAEALYAVALGLASLHLGALVALAVRGSGAPQRIGAWRTRRVVATRRTGYACIAISLIPLFLVLRDNLTIGLSQGYTALYGRPQSELLPGALVAVASFAIPGAIFLIAGSAGKHLPLAVGATLILVFSLSMMAVGSRSGAIMPVIACLWIYDRSVSRLSRKGILAGAVLLLIGIPIVAELRDTPGAWKDPGEMLGQLAREEHLATAAIYEMGGSLSTVAYSIELIPGTRPFDLGVSYGYALSTVVPNIAWDVHPAKTHGPLADWLIWTVDPIWAMAGGGLGYSFLAEEYANFGWPGLALLSASLGFLLTRLFRWGTLDGDPAKAAMIATFLASFLIFARSESVSIVRGLLWYSLVPYAGVSLLTFKRLTAPTSAVVGHHKCPCDEHTSAT